MFGFGKEEVIEDDYKSALDFGGGVGGYGLTLPKSKEGLTAGWWCPNCENIYSPSVKECKQCNTANNELRKAEKKRKKNNKMRRYND